MGSSWRLLPRHEDSSVPSGDCSFSKIVSFTKTYNSRLGSTKYDPQPTYNMGDPIDIIHHSYPTLSDYIEHMNRYSSLGAEMVVAKGDGKVRFSVVNIVFAPAGNVRLQLFSSPRFPRWPRRLLLHLYHAVIVSWKYPRRGSFRASNSDDLTDRSFLLRFRALPASARFLLSKQNMGFAWRRSRLSRRLPKIRSPRF